MVGTQSVGMGDVDCGRMASLVGAAGSAGTGSNDGGVNSGMSQLSRIPIKAVTSNGLHSSYQRTLELSMQFLGCPTYPQSLLISLEIQTITLKLLIVRHSSLPVSPGCAQLVKTSGARDPTWRVDYDQLIRYDQSIVFASTEK